MSERGINSTPMVLVNGRRLDDPTAARLAAATEQA
jgi:hypothetical protein